jgi:hypothetical protein
LFTPPERGGSNAPAPTVADSFVTLVAFVPYFVLARIAEQKVPQTFPIGGDGHIACVDVPYVDPGHIGSHQECVAGVCVNVPDIVGPSIGTRSQCADYHWHATLDKDGATQISRDGNSLRLSQGIHVIGQAGVGGTLADILSLSGKNIDVHATPRVNLGASLDRQWCPVVSAVPIGSWVDEASVEVVGRNCVGIDLGALGHPEICAGPVTLGLVNELNHEFDKHRDDLQKAAQTAIPCDTVKPKIASNWHPFAIKIDRGKLTPLYLNIVPKSVAVSGLIPEDDRLRVAVRVGTQTVIEPKPVDMALLSLPPLDPLEADHGNLQINLLVSAPYEFLKQELHQVFANQLIQKDVPGGKVDVHLLDVDVYPTRDSLALGLKIDAKTPGSWFNTKGWVYLHGRPTVVENGKAVKIEDLRFATVVDSAFWTIVESLFQGEILNALNAHATFDLRKEIDKAANEISQAIAKAEVQGLKIVAGAPDLSLGGIYVTGDSLVVLTRLVMPVDAEVTEAILK